MIRQSFTYGDACYPYSVFFDEKRKNRKVKIDVLPSGAVQVFAPPESELPEVKQAVLKRARWISNHVTDARDRLRHVTPREYVSGETHYYLGKRYQLKVVQIGTGEKPTVKMLRGYITVFTRKREREVVRHLLETWYRQRAAAVFDRRLDAIWPNLPWVQSKPDFSLRQMRTQWGSCSPSGRILVNPLLVKAPPACIDYVLVHELCHLRVPDHSKWFFQTLLEVLPNWEATKTRLDAMGSDYFER